MLTTRNHNFHVCWAIAPCWTTDLGYGIQKEEQSTISCLHRQHICSIERQISQPVNQTNLNLEQIGHENNIEQ